MSSSKSNPFLVDLVDRLKAVAREEDVGLWRDVAERLERPRSRWHEVNVSRLERVLDGGDVAVVPGKLLGDGHLTKAVTVAAFQATPTARKKVEDAGGTYLPLEELLEDAPSAEEVRLVG